MGDPVEKYKLSPEQVGFTKKFGQIKKLREVLAGGIQYKASELQEMQRMAQGFDQQIAQFLQSAPTKLGKEVEQPDTSNLVINW